MTGGALWRVSLNKRRGDKSVLLPVSHRDVLLASPISKYDVIHKTGSVAYFILQRHHAIEEVRTTVTGNMRKIWACCS